MSRRLNPLTRLTLAACAWIVVLSLNTPMLSVAVALASWVWARRWSVCAASVLLTAPVAASLAIMHIPHGQGWEGLALAGELSVRFAALVSVFLAAMSGVSVPALAKSLQATRMNSALVYIVCAALQFLPEARACTRRVREAFIVAGRTPRARNLVLPVITQILHQATLRGHRLEAAGIASGQRATVWRPVPDPAWQRWLRWCLVGAALLTVVAAAFGGGGWWRA
ncbi:hypothetical protein ACUY3K_01030 [Corynebacterium uberis]|uniref:energy-coupling factor transporter transmembrane component T n=1 Tax=Corynebacterium TaxID=1716 RepID=UPI001D0A13C7|nr:MULTISPECIES: energy-coupling factor transporter transmembrane component T [Corynebacterium]MCZ9308985.1 energy-coupling factor transporter transmembrane protein EcfT [Corynebacterium sp. c6VSa_13]UDL74546.1 energy-coupling factor transporter transmembrane protein EcfT [Corynebacterium uberis]UDL76620.1 energy-coupling factor transporter transmembrane protein EcfT [Corynebacterium uberis]UDL78833.1 energy-coupling factor transporter transmembrane protein EcfT [Corynebacterium uberis]UDL8111